MIVDVHTHYLGPDAARMAASTTLPGLAHDVSATAPIRGLDARITAMDEAGIAMSLLAAPPFGLIADGAFRRDLVRAANDAVAEACARYPDRLAMSAILPLPDVEASLRELERLPGFPSLRSVTVVAQTLAYRPSTIGFGAVMAALGTLPMILHPSAGVADLHPAFEAFGLASALQAPVSQSLVAADLIASGLMDAHPGLTMILTHAGGDLPLVVERFDERLRGDFALRPSDYLRTRMFADTCGLKAGPAYRLALDMFGPDRLMIGSDWPSRPIAPHVEALAAMALPAPHHEAIGWGNARRVLGLSPAAVP